MLCKGAARIWIDKKNLFYTWNNSSFNFRVKKNEIKLKLNIFFFIRNLNYFLIIKLNFTLFKFIKEMKKLIQLLMLFPFKENI